MLLTGPRAMTDSQRYKFKKYSEMNLTGIGGEYLCNRIQFMWHQCLYHEVHDPVQNQIHFKNYEINHQSAKELTPKQNKYICPYQMYFLLVHVSEMDDLLIVGTLGEDCNL